MSDRDVIAAHALFYDEFGPHMHVCACGWHVPDELEEEYLDGDVAKSTQAHAAHVVAALREFRTVRTVAELDALPYRSIVRDPAGRVWQRFVDQWVALGRLSAPTAVPLPARVLYRPGEDGAL